MSSVARKMKARHKNSILAYDMFVEHIESLLLSRITPASLIGEFTTLFLIRYAKSMGALKLLVTNGYEEDSQSQMRILLEQAITYMYISKKPLERIELYNDYRFVDSYKLMRKLEKYRPYVNYDFDKEDIESNFERIRAKERYKNLNRWSDKNLKEMAIEIGEEAEDWYEFIYSLNSSYVHADYLSLKDLIEEEEYGSIILNIGSRDFDAVGIFAKTLQITYSMLREVYQINHIEDANLNEVWKNAMKLIIKEEKVEGDEGN